MTKLTEAVAKAIRDADDDMQPRENWEYYVEHAEAAIRIVAEAQAAEIAALNDKVSDLENAYEDARKSKARAVDLEEVLEWYLGTVGAYKYPGEIGQWARKDLEEDLGQRAAKALRDGGEG